MDGVMCPMQCVRAACPDPGFIEKNGAWVLTVAGLVCGCVGTVLTYFLKSRCTFIRCCGVELVRQPIKLDPEAVTVSKT
jgi:hypothetical protein